MTTIQSITSYETSVNASNPGSYVTFGQAMGTGGPTGSYVSSTYSGYVPSYFSETSTNTVATEKLSAIRISPKTERLGILSQEPLENNTLDISSYTIDLASSPLTVSFAGVTFDITQAVSPGYVSEENSHVYFGRKELIRESVKTVPTDPSDNRMVVQNSKFETTDSDGDTVIYYAYAMKVKRIIVEDHQYTPPQSKTTTPATPLPSVSSGKDILSYFESGGSEPVPKEGPYSLDIQEEALLPVGTELKKRAKGLDVEWDVMVNANRFIPQAIAIGLREILKSEKALDPLKCVDELCREVSEMVVHNVPGMGPLHRKIVRAQEASMPPAGVLPPKKTCIIDPKNYAGGAKYQGESSADRNYGQGESSGGSTLHCDYIDNGNGITPPYVQDDVPRVPPINKEYNQEEGCEDFSGSVRIDVEMAVNSQNVNEIKVEASMSGSVVPSPVIIPEGEIEGKALSTEGAGEPPESIGPFSLEETKRIMAGIRHYESTNNYSAENGLGFLGAYQFGWAALWDQGVVGPHKKPEKMSNKTYLRNPANWRHPQIKSHQHFLAAKKFQDACVCRLFNSNYKVLAKTTPRGAFSGSFQSKEDICGWLFVAHLLGAGSVQKLWWGESGGLTKDANGTTWQKYYKRGKGVYNGVLPK